MHWTFYVGVILVGSYGFGNIARACHKVSISTIQIMIPPVGVGLIFYSIFGISW